MQNPAMYNHPPAKLSMKVIIIWLKNLLRLKMTSLYHVEFAMPLTQIHQVDLDIFEHWLLGYIVLGPAFLLPEHQPVLLHVLGSVEQLSLFRAISGMYHPVQKVSDFIFFPEKPVTAGWQI
jgi:hypothetical protein